MGLQVGGNDFSRKGWSPLLGAGVAAVGAVMSVVADIGNIAVEMGFEAVTVVEVVVKLRLGRMDLWIVEGLLTGGMGLSMSVVVAVVVLQVAGKATVVAVVVGMMRHRFEVSVEVVAESRRYFGSAGQVVVRSHQIQRL